MIAECGVRVAELTTRTVGMMCREKLFGSAELIRNERCRVALGCHVPQSAIRNPHSNGFTLIETVITLIILSIAAVGVLSVFNLGIGESADPNLRNQAMALAQEKMEDIAALRVSDGFGAVVPNAGGAFPAPFAAFSWAQTVECVTQVDVNTSTGAPPCASGYAKATVTITWGGDSLSMTTLVTEH